MKYEHAIRLLLVGNSGVGKTSLLHSYKYGDQDSFDNVQSTISMNFTEKLVSIEGKNVPVFIFDLAGQSKFKPIVKSQYSIADGIIIVYDISDTQSYLTLKQEWMNDINKNCQKDVNLLLLGNKADLKDNSIEPPTNFIKNFTEEYDIQHIVTSAKHNLNVHEAFNNIIKSIYQRKKNLQEQLVSKLKSQKNKNKSLQQQDEKQTPPKQIQDKTKEASDSDNESLPELQLVKKRSSLKEFVSKLWSSKS